MHEILLRKLIDKDYFKAGTEVDATYRGVDLSGQPIHIFEETYTVARIMETRKTKRILIDIHSTRDGRPVRIAVDNIIKIDGMTPERFAENYMITTDGDDILPTGARRGRRPNNWTPENDRFLG